MGKYAPNRPEGAVVIREHKRLIAKARLFAEGKYPFLLVIGRSGTGKTEVVRRVMEGIGFTFNDPDTGYGYHRGRITGIELYKWLYCYRNRPIVIDDTPDMCRERYTQTLIQALTETTQKARCVSWRSNHPDIGLPGEADGDRQKTPPEFNTTSSVIIITNDWPSASETIKSIETRATQTILFSPTNDEIHRVYVPTWFDTSSPVYSFIGEHLDEIPYLHCRYYRSGEALRLHEPEYWRQDLLSAMLPESEYSLTIFRTLYNDDKYASDVERIQEFKRLEAGSSATWKRIKSDLGLSRRNRETKKLRTPAGP